MRLLSTALLATMVAGLAGCMNNPEPRAPQGYNPGQWGPMAPQAGWQGQPPQQQPSFWPMPAPVYRPVNVPALLALQGRIPCAPREVAPGTWATFDCAPFQAVSRALQYIPYVRWNFLPTGPVPASVDHRNDRTEGPVKDQGAVGVCTAVSLSTAMDNAIRRMGRADVVSALHIWSNYGVPVMGKAGDSNVDRSITVEQVWQYDPAKACKLMRSPMDTCTTAYGVSSGSESFDADLKAEHRRADDSGRYRLASLEQLKTKPADPNEVAAVLAGGDDVWISFSVNDEAWMSRSLQNAVIPDYEVTSEAGHAVVLAGYRTLPNGTKQFLVHNSWSTRWGDNGYGWISEAMVSRFTRAAYRVRVGEGPGKAAPSSPSSAGCPEGQTPDPIFGACIPGAIPGIPGLPGPKAPAQPAPQQPQQPQQPKAPSGGCPEGQTPDLMGGGCRAACPGGVPSVGGMCLPIPR
jgi:hypothetical protein